MYHCLINSSRRALVCFCLSPCRHIGGEVGTVVGIHELGSASDVFPLSRSSATCRRFTAFYKILFLQVTPSGMNLLSLSLSQCPSPGRTPVCFSPYPSSLAEKKRLKKTGVQEKLPSSRIQISFSDNVCFEMDDNRTVPITLQRRRRLVVSPSPASRGLSLQDGGNGMRRPIGRWNLRRRGSTVTTGLNVAWFPNCRVSSSSGIGWAWVVTREETKDSLINY